MNTGTDFTAPLILAKLAEWRCLYCGALMLEGSRRGYSVNVECDDCGARFNLLGARAELGAQLLNAPTTPPQPAGPAEH